MNVTRTFGILLLSLLLFSCAPVFDRAVMREGDREVSFSRLRTDPAAQAGRLYIFGGVIVETKLTSSGSQIEAMEVPVDRYGDFEESGISQGRFLAFAPADAGMLDPEVYRKGRRVTIAGEFTELRRGMIDELEYSYPVFRIRQIHLWPRERRYYPAAYYDPWLYPFPYYYGGPWWSYPYYYYPYYGYGHAYGGYYYGGTWIGPRRPPPPNVPPPTVPRPPQRLNQAPGGAGEPMPATPERPAEPRGHR